jgi:hypothetical protein
MTPQRKPSPASPSNCACNRLKKPTITRTGAYCCWGIPGLSGWGYAGVLRPYIVGLLVCLPAKSPRESSPPLRATTHEEEDHDEP